MRVVTFCKVTEFVALGVFSKDILCTLQMMMGAFLISDGSC